MLAISFNRRLIHYLKLMRFDKPIGILLLLWPTLWALWIAADGHPSVSLVFIFTLGVILMRAAGCVLNDLADRHFDGHVKRTQNRPLASGAIHVREAVIIFCCLSLTALILVLMLNTLTIQLAVLGLILALIYPFMKRLTHWPQFILGLAFSWGIPMAFAATQQQVPIIAWLLFATAVLWAIAYDTQYAMADRDDDIKIGLKSTAILFAHYDRFVIGLIQCVVLVLWLLCGLWLQMNFGYYIALIAAALLFCYQQFLIRHRKPQRCFQAFLNNNSVGLLVFVGIVLGYL